MGFAGSDGNARPAGEQSWNLYLTTVCLLTCLHPAAAPPAAPLHPGLLSLPRTTLLPVVSGGDGSALHQFDRSSHSCPESLSCLKLGCEIAVSVSGLIVNCISLKLSPTSHPAAYLSPELGLNHLTVTFSGCQTPFTPTYYVVILEALAEAVNQLVPAFSLAGFL